MANAIPNYDVYDVQQDLHKAMQRLGLNPTEQEVVDIPNEIAR